MLAVMKNISTLKNEAREALRGNWGIAAVTTFLVTVICGCTCGAPGLGYFFLAVPIEYGFSIAILKLLRGDNLLVDNTFSSAFDNYIHKVGTGALSWIYIFLWSLLLIVPGIIKALAYAMVPFILEDEPTLSAEETLRRSSAMMAGHKWDLFVLYLSFIGWWILSILTFGIGFFFLTPYVRATVAAFYEDLKG
jgi:uncharacterized membrane protein